MRKDQVLETLEEHAAEIRGRFKVKSLRLFGSVARDESWEGSDIDLLVDFSGPRTFKGYMGLRIFLEDLLGMKVDLVTETGLKERVRPYIEKDAIRVA
jgi:predicted nucleotidyltransferase